MFKRSGMGFKSFIKLALLIVLGGSTAYAVEPTIVINSTMAPVNISGPVTLAPSSIASNVVSTSTYIVNPVTATIVGLNSVTTTYVVNPTTVTVSNLFNGTTVYVVNPTTTTVIGLNSVTTTYVMNPTTTTIAASNNAIGSVWSTSTYVTNVTTVTQGAAGLQDWAMRVASVTVKTGTAFLGVDHSSGVKVNTLGGQNLGIDLSSGALTTVFVSSNVNMPAQTNDAAFAKTMGDNEGRPVVVSGVPSSVILTTAPTSALNGFMVLVASPAATSFVHMCYCAFTNTSAAATSGTLYPSGGVVNPNIVFGIGISATTPLGTGCGTPFLNTTVGGSQVTWRPVGAVTTLFGYCQYYLSNSP